MSCRTLDLAMWAFPISAEKMISAWRCTSVYVLVSALRCKSEIGPATDINAIIVS